MTTLRKANALQAEIRKALKTATVKDTIGITEFTVHPTTALHSAMAAYAVDIERRVALNTALFNIRKAVALANVNSGISDILAEVQLIDATIAIYAEIASKEPAKTMEEISARLAKVLLAPAAAIVPRLYRSTEEEGVVSTSVVRTTDITSAAVRVKLLNRQKRDLQDKLLSLNTSTTIKISEEDVKVLQAEGILEAAL